MSFLKRLQSAWTGFRQPMSQDKLKQQQYEAWHAMKAMAVHDSQANAFWKDRQPTWKIEAGNYDVLAEEGFKLNALIYSAIMFKVRAISQTPLRVFRGDPLNPRPVSAGHKLNKLIQRPNPHQSWYEFQSLVTIYKNLSGNAYIWMDKASAGLPSQLITLRPDHVRLIFNDDLAPTDPDFFLGYAFIPHGWNSQDAIPLLPDDVMHIKFPNPLDPYEGQGYGLSPLAPLARSGDVDNAVTDFLKLFFENGAMPPGYLKFDQKMTSEQVAKARERWMDIYGGYEEWVKVAVLDQGGSYQRSGYTFDEMGFDGVDERNESRILGPLGVPAILIGSRLGLKHATYSNADTLLRLFWELTMQPELRQDEVEYQHYLKDGTAFVMFDVSQVRALQQDMIKLAEAAYKLWTMGMPGDEALDTVGIRAKPLPAGDEGFIPGSMVSVEDEEDPPPQLPPQNMNDGDEPSDEQNQPSKALVYKEGHDTAEQVLVAVDGHLPAFETAAREQFEQDKREVLAIIKQAETAARKAKASILWGNVEDDILAYLKEIGAENWREVFTPLMEGVVIDVGTIWATELGVTFDVRNIRGEAWFSDYTLQFAQEINDTTKEHIQAVLAQGQAEGWSIPTMQDHLTDLFTQYRDGNLTAEDFAWFTDRLPPHRTELIARTETTRAAGAGAHNLFDQWGVQEREWLSTEDGRTRPSHAAANGQIRKMDDPFQVGGYDMMYPGDMSLGAPVGEIANCRCTVVPKKFN